MLHLIYMEMRLSRDNTLRYSDCHHKGLVQEQYIAFAQDRDFPNGIRSRVEEFADDCNGIMLSLIEISLFAVCYMRINVQSLTKFFLQKGRLDFIIAC